jgi:hypothetical protein
MSDSQSSEPIDLATDEPPSIKRKRKWAWKDTATFVFSVVAFVLSVLGAYFNFFRDETDLLAAVVTAEVHAERDGVREAYRVDVAVMNTGNRQVAVTEGALYVVPRSGGYVDLRSFIDPMTLPALIEPGKMAVLTFEARDTESLLRFLDDAVPGEQAPNNNYTQTTTVELRLRAIGATGTQLQVNMRAVKIFFYEARVSSASADLRPVPFIRQRIGS